METSPTPRLCPEFRPGRLWSLWDMVANFSFTDVHSLLGEMGRLISVSHNNMRLAQNTGGIAGAFAQANDTKHEEAVKQANETGQWVYDQTLKLLGDLKSPHINDALVKLRYWLVKDKRSWSELNTRTRALRDNIETELRGLLYYQYPTEKARKLRAYKVEWAAVLKAFPDIDDEVFSAVDCWALQQDTASVFHSMRVAEYGLRALARERKIRLPKDKPLEWGTWQEIITKLDEQIKLIAAKKAGKAKDAALSFYSGARADLNGFKDEFRNMVMHARITYDEHQALRALTNVHAFMERLSAKLNHTHKRINWGKF